MHKFCYTAETKKKHSFQLDVKEPSWVKNVNIWNSSYGVCVDSFEYSIIKLLNVRRLKAYKT